MKIQEINPETNYVVERDGNSYCCHGIDFIDLQSSDNYSFVETEEEAIRNYQKLMSRRSK